MPMSAYIFPISGPPREPFNFSLKWQVAPAEALAEDGFSFRPTPQSILALR